MRIPQLGPQIISQQIGFNLIERLVQLRRFDLQGEPGMVATGQMIALRAGHAALALFTASQLLEASVKFFDLPAHVVRVLSNLRRHGLVWAMGNHPVNVAVCGDQLE